MNDYVKAAERYAYADRSDPFTFNRAMTHLQSGIASHRQDDGDYPRSAGNPAFYNANVVVEETTTEDSPFAILGDVRKRNVTRFRTIGVRNVMRP